VSKGEFKLRLRGCGKTLGVMAREEGISIRNVYNWVEVPRWAEWYLLYQEERQRNVLNPGVKGRGI